MSRGKHGSQATGRMELPFTEMSKVLGGASLGERLGI